MKIYILTILLSIFFMQNLLCQSIFITEQGSFGCMNNQELIYSGSDNGTPSRNIYVGMQGTATRRIRWNSSGNNWILETNNNSGGGYFTEYINNYASHPNPPGIPSLWLDFSANICAPITQIYGSGTQTVLPVELISFEGSINDTEVELNWHTASEINNDKFEIERSSNGITYTKIGEIVGNRNSSDLKTYFFRDVFPSVGMNYYRLKQLDLDGKLSYSKTINLKFFPIISEIGEFYPNPVYASVVRIDFFSNNSESLEISLFDINGRVKNIQSYDLNVGKNTLQISLLDLIDGMYIAKIKNGSNYYIKKLMVKGQ